MIRGEFLLGLIAELLGADSGGAVGVKGEVGVEISKQSGVILLEQVNVGEKAVNDRRARSKDAGPFGGSKGGGKLILHEEEAAEFVMGEPKIGVEFQAFAYGLFGIV